jgi:hypothetical protein
MIKGESSGAGSVERAGERLRDEAGDLRLAAQVRVHRE